MVRALSIALSLSFVMLIAACSKETEKKSIAKNKEITLSIIKPDAVSRNVAGQILAKLENSGLRVSAIKMKKLTPKEAEEFYKIHEGKPFYKDLVAFMSSGPVIAIALEGDNAVAKNRAVMGATDPSKSQPGTIRRDFAESVTRNAVHGSDSVENAQTELLFFFEPNDLQERF